MILVPVSPLTNLPLYPPCPFVEVERKTRKLPLHSLLTRLKHVPSNRSLSWIRFWLTLPPVCITKLYPSPPMFT